MLFLHTIAEVLTEYFKELEEESIRDNFVIIYELLDEMMDFGYPQTTESKILQEYITQDAYKLEVQVRPPMAVTNAVSWRSEGIRYRKNEVFLDVVESVNLLVNANGNVLRSEILGAVKMKVFLSGMPELRLGLNDKVMFESTGRCKYSDIERGDIDLVYVARQIGSSPDLTNHFFYFIFPQQRKQLPQRASRSRWRMSSSTSVCAFQSSRTTGQFLLSLQMASST